MKTAKNLSPAACLRTGNRNRHLLFYFALAHLKHLYRQGWLRVGVPAAKCESVAEHSFGVAALALCLAPERPASFDVSRAVALALVHDMGETFAGDIMPSERISARRKHRVERRAISRLFRGLPAGRKLAALWAEYEASKTAEAKFVRELDKLEMALQASVYGRQLGTEVREFFDTADGAVHDGRLRRILKSALAVSKRKSPRT